MPLVTANPYSAPFPFQNAYVNTIYPPLFRNNGLSYHRQRLYTPDDDFLDLDWAFSLGGSKRLVVVVHGLEGNSQSQYSKGICRYFSRRNFDAVAINLRSCSGENNWQSYSYNMGVSHDLDFVLRQINLTRHYEQIVLIGFSLGGNIVLKYLGERPCSTYAPNLVAAVTYSVPIHIESSNNEISKYKNRLFLKKFLRTMNAKALDKMEKMPDRFPVYDNFSPKNFMEYDGLITAPVSGYQSAQDYWTKSSSYFFLEHIKLPTLLVNSVDDTFLSELCYPYALSKRHPYIHFQATKYGGHCGFYLRNQDHSVWYETQSHWFIDEVVSK